MGGVKNREIETEGEKRQITDSDEGADQEPIRPPGTRWMCPEDLIFHVFTARMDPRTVPSLT